MKFADCEVFELPEKLPGLDISEDSVAETLTVHFFSNFEFFPAYRQLFAVEFIEDEAAVMREEIADDARELVPRLGLEQVELIRFLAVVLYMSERFDDCGAHKHFVEFADSDVAVGGLSEKVGELVEGNGVFAERGGVIFEQAHRPARAKKRHGGEADYVIVLRVIQLIY